MAQMCGGPTDIKIADQEIQEICDKIRKDLEGQSGKQFTNFKAVSFRSQVVAGTNFFIKIEVDDGEHIHVRVFRGLPHAGEKLELNKFQAGKTPQDPIEYF